MKFKSIIIFLSYLCLMMSLTSCKNGLDLTDVIPQLGSTSDTITIDVSQYPDKVDYEIEEKISNISFTGKSKASWNITVADRT